MLLYSEYNNKINIIDILGKQVSVNDMFIRPRQKHKQHSSTIYKKYEKTR